MWKIRKFSLQSGLKLMTTHMIATEPQRLATYLLFKFTRQIAIYFYQFGFEFKIKNRSVSHESLIFDYFKNCYYYKLFFPPLDCFLKFPASITRIILS